MGSNSGSATYDDESKESYNIDYPCCLEKKDQTKENKRIQVGVEDGKKKYKYKVTNIASSTCILNRCYNFGNILGTNCGGFLGDNSSNGLTESIPNNSGSGTCVLTLCYNFGLIQKKAKTSGGIFGGVTANNYGLSVLNSCTLIKQSNGGLVGSSIGGLADSSLHCSNDSQVTIFKCGELTGNSNIKEIVVGLLELKDEKLTKQFKYIKEKIEDNKKELPIILITYKTEDNVFSNSLNSCICWNTDSKGKCCNEPKLVETTYKKLYKTQDEKTKKTKVKIQVCPSKKK